MELICPEFAPNQPIPKKFTGEGADVSPPLHFHGVPQSAKSLVIIVDDPDAPMGTFDHWIGWNIPANVGSLPEGASLPKEGLNHFNEQRYRGPLPPPGTPHRYFFKVYALDTMLDLAEGSTKKQVEDAIEGHVLGSSQLIGIYQR